MFKVSLLQNWACEQVQEDNTRAAAILNWANLESGLLRWLQGPVHDMPLRSWAHPDFVYFRALDIKEGAGEKEK